MTTRRPQGSTCNSTIPHGRVNWYTCEDIQNGQKCLYSCDPGYQSHRLLSFLSCDRHKGRWTLYNPLVVFMYNFPAFDEEVLCSPRLCPNTIPNGILSENCEAAVDSPPCNYTCKKGFIKTIQESLTCLHTARWNRDLFSLCKAKDGKQCSSILPDADLDLSCDRRPGSTCKYQCRTPYYTLHSPPNILCQETDLTWSHKQVCSSVKCPRSFQGGQISDPCDLYEGSTCRVQCNDGYRVTNNSLQVTCLPSGHWGPNPATICQKKARCPPVYKDGSIDYRCDLYSGSTCFYNCKQGFTKYVDQVLVTCLDNGKWSTDLTGICVKETLCPAFVPNGRISSFCSRRESETCSIICNLGYTLNLPGMTTTCLSFGRWDVDLSNVCTFEMRQCLLPLSFGHSIHLKIPKVLPIHIEQKMYRTP
ncbi:hypothetical protein CHS0354_009077 [Potamilus streckersoni]|uniref:Sushi domain-containing protein n=1 Tax=Potamilus streckersoni TaxID=2493646 RepID=A0AAE0WCU9_9BIVA|nr:hypothetical protein CHS0354_009077 [Potamilus streckersoni]